MDMFFIVDLHLNIVESQLLRCKSIINVPFSIAMLNYQRVTIVVGVVS